MANRSGLPFGYSDYHAMKPYIYIAEKTKANAMKLFEQEMEK
jgi:hypothetical protein